MINCGVRKVEIVAKTNQFYTLIPHNFGNRKPELLDSIEIIKAKAEAVTSLLEIEIGFSIFKSEGENEENPFDYFYKNLNCSISVGFSI